MRSIEALRVESDRYAVFLVGPAHREQCVTFSLAHIRQFESSADEKFDSGLMRELMTVGTEDNNL